MCALLASMMVYESSIKDSTGTSTWPVGNAVSILWPTASGIERWPPWLLLPYAPVVIVGGMSIIHWERRQDEVSVYSSCLILCLISERRMVIGFLMPERMLRQNAPHNRKEIYISVDSCSIWICVKAWNPLGYPLFSPGSLLKRLFWKEYLYYFSEVAQDNNPH